MIITRVFLISFSLSLSVIVFGQKGKIHFEEKSHNFGEIKELDGSVSHTFTFENKGTTPLRIKKVDVGCGCTTPDWSQDPIAPGESGFIKANFDPTNRPGEFEKYLTIHTDGWPEIEEVSFTGYVEPKPKTLEDDYPYEYGGLRFKERNLKFGLLTTEKSISKSFEVFNQTDSLLTIDKAKLELPSHIQVDMPSISPKESGVFNLTYDPIIKNDWGSYIRDRINIPLSSGTIEKELTVIASIEEYFPKMNELELANSPQIQLEKKDIKLPAIKAGAKVNTRLNITNIGKEALIIRKAFSSCKCIDIRIPKNKVEPNESIELDITFDSTSRTGRQSKKIMIYSNSPKSPYTEVTLSTTVK